ncbi:MAG: hypothetical protein HYS41_04455 [Candidatus Omnitrophica bacterium]|nr:hypothetical protein [Candidatus Omnitrophota bacterium]
MTFLFLPPAFAQKALRIGSVSYDQHVHSTELIKFTVAVKNNEATTQFAEVDITLTNVETEQELTLVPVLTGNVLAGQESVLVTTYQNIPDGTYTVSFPLFDGDGVRVDRVTGSTPIHIGTETETLQVFPEVIHLGTLPPGRAMFPTPIEVRWAFYRFNRLRLDQPFYIRIYSDNAARYRGVRGALRRNSPAGLVSADGRFAIPLKLWNLNYGPDMQEGGWDAALAGPPPVDDDAFWIGPELLEGGRNLGSANWVRIPDLSEMTSDPVSWRRLIGQDPFDNRYVSDSNQTGDFTLKSPFTLYLAAEAGPTAVEGAYTANLVVELWDP